MSLTSRIFNFFAPDQLTPTDGRESIGLVEGEDYGGVRGDISLQAGRRKETLAIEKGDEEGRPPYLHVRPAKICWGRLYKLFFDRFMTDCTG